MNLFTKNNENKKHCYQISIVHKYLLSITLISSEWAIVFHIMTRGDIKDPIVYEQYLVSIVLIFITNYLLLKKNTLRVRLLTLLISYLVLVFVYYCFYGIDYWVRSYLGIL